MQPISWLSRQSPRDAVARAGASMPTVTTACVPDEQLETTQPVQAMQLETRADERAEHEFDL
jgi:hypothetical protein